MKSLYAQYLMEKTEDRIIEVDAGFATYRFTDSNTVYIVDIYIKPEFRKKGAASDLAGSIEKEAKIRGCTSMIGSVVPSNKASTDSIRVLLAYGMRLDSSGNDFILFRKDI